VSLAFLAVCRYIVCSLRSNLGNAANQRDGSSRMKIETNSSICSNAIQVLPSATFIVISLGNGLPIQLRNTYAAAVGGLVEKRHRSSIYERDHGDKRLHVDHREHGTATFEHELYAFVAFALSFRWISITRVSLCLCLVNRLTNKTLKKLVFCLYYQNYLLLSDLSRGLLHVYLKVTLLLAYSADTLAESPTQQASSITIRAAESRRTRTG